MAAVTPRFELGRILTTPGAISRAGEDVIVASIRRHVAGDWGTLCDDDRTANEAALKDGARLMSVYPIDPEKPCAGDNRLWVITEWDRSATTALLPEEY